MTSSFLFSQLLHNYAQASPRYLVTGCVLVILVIWVIHKFIIYPNFICPTRHIPGPYITKCTSFWLLHHGFWDSANDWILSVHEKYGPVATLSPTQVSFNTIEVISAIYGVRSDFYKSPSVAAMDNYDMPNTFSSVSNADHRRRRARYAGVYSKTNMTSGQAYKSISRRTTLLLNIIRSYASRGESVDVYKLFHYYSIDNASLVASGTSPNLLAGENCEFSSNLRIMFLGLAAVSYFDIYRHISAAIEWLPHYLQPPLLIFRPVKRAYEAHTKVESFNLSHFEKSRNTQQPEIANSVMSRLLDHKDFGGDDLSVMHVASEISDHLLAGADTLVASLTYTIWELARPKNKIHLDRLYAELAAVHLIESSIPEDYALVDSLSWLECCIKEGLRLHTPSGHIQIRSVPVGGTTLGGYYISEGLEVGIPLYAIQLNRHIFSQPSRFDPSRWLPTKDNAEQLAKMNKAYMTFGYGARVCVGKELAILQSKLLLSTLLSQFEVKLDEEQDQGEMVGIQAAVLAPRGGRCLLNFEEREREVVG